jgi:hypothetical protein
MCGSCIVSINVHPSLRQPKKDMINKLVKIQFRVADGHEDQSQLGTNHHLSLHEVMNVASISKLAHKCSKILRLGVTRKHNIINHGQGTVAEVKKIPDLGGAILKQNNKTTPILITPKVNIVGSGKTNKIIDSGGHSLFFESSIHKSA